jgi:hypothetical protein
MVWVRERTIPTERPPLVGEVIANFCGYRAPRGQRDGSLRPYSRFSRQEPLLFYPVAPQLYSRGWMECRESNPGLRICSQELWSLDHIGGPWFVTVHTKSFTQLPTVTKQSFIHSYFIYCNRSSIGNLPLDVEHVYSGTVVLTLKNYKYVKDWAPVQKAENAAVGIHHADHVAPLYQKKLALTSPTSSGRLVGIVRSRTQATEFSFSKILGKDGN